MAPNNKTKRKEGGKAKKKRGQLFQYSEHQLRQAIDAVQTAGSSLRAAARIFNVPVSTLSYKLRGIRPIERKMGPQSMLGSNMENKIVKCLFTLADAGFPITKEQLMDNVTNLAQKQEVNPFKNGRPSNKWFQLFRSRHPMISMRVAQNISRARAGVTEENLRNWFRNVEKFCETNNCTEALSDPKRIYNLDESAFFLSPEVGKVMSKKGARTVYNVSRGNDRQCTTVLMGGNAAGQLIPPMAVFKNKIFPKNVSTKWPDDWGIGTYETISSF